MDDAAASHGIGPVEARDGPVPDARRSGARLAAGLAICLASAPLPVMAGQEGAAWLQICPAGTPDGGGLSAPLALPGNPPLRLRAGKRLEGCGGIALPVPPARIAAIRAVSLSDRASEARTILVYRPEQASRPKAAFGTVETVLPPSATAAGEQGRDSPPWHANLLNQLQLRPYGVEERVQAQVRDGRLTLQCRAGSRPAGLLLSAPWTMPQAALVLAAQYRADGRFTLSLADEAASRAESALELGHLDVSGPAAGSVPADAGQAGTQAAADSAPASAVLALPTAGWERTQWRHFALACPGHGATLTLDSLQLQPQPAAPPPRATWVWRSSAWISHPASVLALARRHGMRTLFITVPTRGAAVQQPARLAAFVRQARQAGIALWALEGDPHMALPEHHAATIDRVRAIAAYNRGAAPAARLHGVQFDIEHYLLDGYGLAAQQHDRAYAQLLAKLKAAAAGLPLDFVAPFWWRSNGTVLGALAQAASVVTVMDYRTDAAQIRDFATPFLDWGARHGVGVRIALESGAIAPEYQHRYVRADGAPAELWAIPLAPQQSGLAAPLDVLVLLKQPHAGLPGTGFRYGGNRLLDGSATTFQRQPERLQALLPQLERDFSAWPTFAGMAVHEPGDAVTVQGRGQAPAPPPPSLPPSGAR